MIESVRLSDMDSIKYLYLCDGTKLSAVNSAGVGLDYLGSSVYTRNGSGLALERSEKIYYIGEKNAKGRTNRFLTYNNNIAVIYWDPNTAAQTSEGIWLSPATILAHEMGHAIQYDTAPTKFSSDSKIDDAEYYKKEERRNITTTEQRVAKKHKEIDGKTVTRKNHKIVNKDDVSKLTPYEIEEKFSKTNQPFNSAY